MPTNRRVAEYTAPARGFRIYLVLTTVVCGWFVMTIEVLGSRVLGPFFGVSLFVWTSLITVTLLALALGYAAGGVLSDRSPGPDPLFSIVTIAGLAVLAIPWLKAPVLKACIGLGLRLGAFVSAALLFGPALILLGCVSPWVVRLAASEMKSIGRTVGRFSALSTGGSLLGTVVTGFVLVAHAGVARTFQATGIALVVLGSGYFLVFRGRVRPVAGAVAVLLVLRSEPLTSKRLADGTAVEVTFRKDGYYGEVKVVDYSFRERHTRELLVDGTTQGGIDVTTGESIYEFPYALALYPWAVGPGGRSALVLGVGPGAVARWFEERGVVTDVVDIDPVVLDVARERFGVRVSGEVILADARAYLERTERRWDYIALDVFNGDTMPVHVLSREAVALLRAHLTQQGVLAANLIGSLRRDPFVVASIVRTLRTAFENVEVHPLHDPEGEAGWGNITVVAYGGAPRPSDFAAARSFPVHPMAREGLARFLGRTFSFPEGTPSTILTDDFNPIDVHDRWIKERFRRNVLADLDWDILL